MTREEKRMLFEKIVQSPMVTKYMQFPLGALTVNDKFHHYMDSYTDSAWAGFLMGVHVMEHLDDYKDK